MHYLYLDESGDLGTQFQNSGTSQYLVITVLAIEGEVARKSVEKAIERTMKNKLRKNPRRRSRYATELKGTNTELTDKRYFYRYDLHESKALQAVDLFAWGIHRKYELRDLEWYDMFQEKLAYEMIYPP